MMSARAIVLLLPLAIGALTGGSGAVAQQFPTRPIRLIVPFPPGGSNDILARLLAQRLSERYGQQVVVDNRPGADGIIGTELAARASPDGHTLLVISASYAMNAALHKLPYDPVKSFEPLALIGSGPNLVSVHAGSAIGSIRELIAAAQKAPGRINYASSGIGGFNHFGGELFKVLAKVNLNHVPYKGGGPAMTDVIAGQVPVLFSTLVQAQPQVRGGKLRALGVGSAKRSPAMPDVPSVQEAGLAGYEVVNWWGFLAPAGTPVAIVRRINADINAVIDSAETRKRLEAEAAEPAPGAPDAFRKVIVDDLAKWSRVAKEADIRPH